MSHLNHLSSIMSEYKVSRKALSLSDKLHILKVVDDNTDKKKVEIARQLNLPISTLNTLVSKRKEIEEHANLSGSLCATKKRFQLGRYRDMEICLAKWIETSGAKCVPLNGPIVMEKAKELAVEMGLPDQFAASSGWLHKFKLRFDLHNKALKRRNKGSKRKITHITKAWLQEKDSEEGDHMETEAECFTGIRETLKSGPADQIDVKEETPHLEEEFNAGTRNSDQQLGSVKIEPYDSNEDVIPPEQDESSFFVTVPGSSSALPVDISLQQHVNGDYSFPFSSAAFQEPSTSQLQRETPVRGQCKCNSHPQFQFVDVDDNESSLLLLSQVQGMEILRKDNPSTKDKTAELYSHALKSDLKPHLPIQICNPTSPSTLKPMQSSESANSQLVVCYQSSHQWSPATVSEFCPSDPVRTNGNHLKAVSSLPSIPFPQADESHIGQTTSNTYLDPVLEDTSQSNDVQLLHRRIWELEMQIEKFKQQIAVRDEKKCGPLCQLISMDTLQAHLLSSGFGAMLNRRSQESLATSLFQNECMVQQTRNSDRIPGSEEQPNLAQNDSQGKSCGTSTRLVTKPPVNHKVTSITALVNEQKNHRPSNTVSAKVNQAQFVKKNFYGMNSNTRFGPVTVKTSVTAHNKKNREKKAKSTFQTILQHINSRVSETKTHANST